MKIKKPLRALGAALGVTACILGGAAFLNWQFWGLEVTHTQVPVSGLPQGFEGMRVVHLSDLHGHQYGEDHQDLLEQIAAQSPELIALTGDIIDQASQRGTLPALARGLSAIAPTYFVTGNHEWAVGDIRQTKELLAENGVTVLSNQYVVLERNGDQVVLAGVDDANGYADQKTPQELYEEIQQDHPGLCTLLLAHRNNYFDRYAACGYALVLSGHAHGGPHLDRRGVHPGREHPVRHPRAGQQHHPHSGISDVQSAGNFRVGTSAPISAPPPALRERA